MTDASAHSPLPGTPHPTLGQVINELDDQPRVSADDAIREARVGYRRLVSSPWITPGRVSDQITHTSSAITRIAQKG